LPPPDWTVSGLKGHQRVVSEVGTGNADPKLSAPRLDQITGGGVRVTREDNEDPRLATRPTDLKSYRLADRRDAIHDELGRLALQVADTDADPSMPGRGTPIARRRHNARDKIRGCLRERTALDDDFIEFGRRHLGRVLLGLSR
jgi:hypothetical protein